MLSRFNDFDQTSAARIADNQVKIYGKRPANFKAAGFVTVHWNASRDTFMRKSIVRIYQETRKGRTIHSQPDPAAGEHRVHMRAGDMLAWLADANAEDRAWLNDFADEEVIISQDLYEVIQAYRHFRRSA